MKTKQIMYVLLAMTFLFAACAPEAAPVDQASINEQIQTSVALTVSAGEGLTQEAEPTATFTVVAPPTNTPFPTLTPFATITPFVVTPSSGGTSGGSGSGGTSGTTYYGGEVCGDGPKYMAAIIDQKPHDGSPETIRKTGEIEEQMDVFWTMKNIGTKDWEPTFAWIVDSEVVNSDIPANKSLSLNPVAFNPADGPGLGTPVPLGVLVEKDEYITMGVELTMPTNFDGPKPIYFVVQMALVGDAGYKFCFPYIQIELIRPGMQP